MDHKANLRQAVEPTGYSQMGDCGKLLNISFLICKMGMIWYSLQSINEMITVIALSTVHGSWRGPSNC